MRWVAIGCFVVGGGMFGFLLDEALHYLFLHLIWR
jgi:hypothetical protein